MLLLTDNDSQMCLKTFSTKNLYLGNDPKSYVETAMSSFPDVFKEPSETDGSLKVMKESPMKIQLKAGPIIPTKIYAARKTPYAFKKVQGS